MGSGAVIHFMEEELVLKLMAVLKNGKEGNEGVKARIAEARVATMENLFCRPRFTSGERHR